MGRNLTGTNSGWEGALTSLVTWPMLTVVGVFLDDDDDDDEEEAHLHGHLHLASRREAAMVRPAASAGADANRRIWT